MKENLVEGFNQEEEKEEKEEMRRYGIKQKQKKKTKINFIINIILGISLFLVVIWIFYLKNQITQKDYEINILSKQKEEMINALNEGKDEINRLSLQNQNIQSKTFTLLEKCFNDTSSLRYQIMDLKKEAAENENNNRLKEIKIPQRPVYKPRNFCNIF